MDRPALKLEDLVLADLEDEVTGEEPEFGFSRSGSDSDPDSHAVAIIGMDGRVGSADSLEEFWQLLTAEREGIRSLPEERRMDLDTFLRAKGVQLPIQEDLYLRSTFMQDIAGFDAHFFGLSQQEANYMDPNQRILLETFWKALEDSGYAGQEVRGSDTGIFVGYSHDFGEDYRQLLNVLDPNAPEISVAGNIKSIIASRLAYHLDLRGPALMVDTACSSGLVAMYLACRAIRNGECSMAVVGAVKTQVLAVLNHGKSGFGIKDIQDIHSESGHTRTFDESSDGTFTAEGSFAFVLKSLKAAKRDGDTIRAVILGGAINQDGASNGITAPNSEAQKDLIVRALDDAGISAEQLSYLEAHGTATRLGDPIEISGIQQALRQFTNKKQFCAVGSLKTNIGHLDNAAGLGGVAKLVLAMENRVLPASVNFSVPNRNIPFVESPVYVNDKTTPWSKQPVEGLRAGINSFGLSGTNCHLVLESAPVEQVGTEEQAGPLLLPLSAKTPEALRHLAAAYQKRMSDPQVKLADAVFTAARGRLHHQIRAAIRFETREQLCRVLGRLAAFGEGALPDPDIRYGEHRVIESEAKRRRPSDLTENDRMRLGAEALALVSHERGRPSGEVLDRWAEIYTAGGDLSWDRLTKGLVTRRIPLPTYPFQHRRCWVEPANRTQEVTSYVHPLLGAPFATMGQTLFKREFRCEDFWELGEHRVQGTGLLPGTALVEMMVDWARRVHKCAGDLRFTEITFLQPFTVEDGTVRELHLLVQDEGDAKRLRFASLSPEGQQWVLHAEGVFRGESLGESSADKADLMALKERMTNPIDLNAFENMDRGLIVGDRWTGSCVGGWTDDRKAHYFIELALPKEFHSEGNAYHLHPALMDLSVNSVNHLMDEKELYLPLSYGELLIHKRLPTRVFVYMKKTSGTQGAKIHSFDITLYDEEGTNILEVKNYCIKSASKVLERTEKKGRYGYKQGFRLYDQPSQQDWPPGAVAVAGKKSATSVALVAALHKQGRRVIELTSGSENWQEAVAFLAGEDLAFAIFTWDPPQHTGQEPEVWKVEANEAVEQGFRFLQAWSKAKISTKAGVAVLTYKGWAVEGNDTDIHPGQAALGGLWRIGGLEFEAWKIRCIDHDGSTPADMLLSELSASERSGFLVYRNGKVFEPVLMENPLPEAVGEVTVSNDGVYVITGGTGGLGTEIAELLARQGVRKLVLLGQRPIPPRESWNQLAASTDDPEVRRRLELWLKLERSLDVLEVRSVQIEKYEQVSSLLSELRTSCGQIRGIFHLAGRAGDGFLLQKPEETFFNVYAPKADGAANLHAATLQDELDFFVSFSSIASLELYPGQSDYTSANLFMDALAAYRQRIGLPALSLQWPAWRETGIAQRMGAVDKSREFAPVALSDALELLERLIRSEGILPAVLMPGEKRNKNAPANDRAGKAEPRKASVARQSTKVTLLGILEPDEIDLAVADIWARTLATDELDADEEFDRLGGNSLLASQLFKEYETLFPGGMHIADLFTYTTIREQATYLRERTVGTEQASAAASIEETTSNTDAVSGEDWDEILELVMRGELTVEESATRISSERGRGK